MAAPDQTPTPPTPLPIHTLACMEVWGGNSAAAEALALPGIDATITCEPWRTADADGSTGGDIYSMSNCMAGIISRFVLADVAGHGPQADELARSLRKLMRRHINTADQSRLAQDLNTEFASLSSAGRFATALIATYFAPTDHLIVCNAGHPAPLWYRSVERRWRALHPDGPDTDLLGEPEEIGVPNLPLGIIEPTSYQQFAVKLGEGDLIIFFTDALAEAADERGRQLGEDGLLFLCESLDLTHPHTVGEQLLAAAKRSTPEHHLDDDATVLVLHHNAADPPRQSIRQRLETLGRMIGLS